MKYKDGLKRPMEKEAEKMDLEKQKIELVRMRIQNGYYNREDILRKVVDRIMNRRSPSLRDHN